MDDRKITGQPGGDVTSINAGYLRGLVSSFLQPLLDEVDTLLRIGNIEFVGGVPTQVPGLSSGLTVPAGDPGFPPAADLVAALGAVGGSVNSNLTWFQKALTDTIDEISTTVASMKDGDDLNAEQAQTLTQDFAGAIADVSQSPTAGSSSGGSSSGSKTNGSPG
jgi:hypothetical protein